MAIENGDILKAVAEYVLPDGTIAQNVFYFVANFLDSETGTAVLGAVKTYLEDFYDAIKAYVKSTVTFNPFTLQTMTWDGGTGKWEIEAYWGTSTINITNESLDDQFPNQVAATLTANTVRPKSRGRKFAPPFVETSALAGDLIGGAVTALTDALSHYIADETVSGENVLSPGVIRAGVDTFLEFTTGVVNSILGTQRRRKPGVGA